MDKILVSHDQHQKLVKMCKEFFPETKDWMDKYVVIYRQTCKICVKEQVLKGIYFNEYEEEDQELLYITLSNDAKIPWFEFCLRYLAPKILDNSCGDIETSELGYFGYGPDLKTNHPIDYLYEEFKRNEKN